MSYLDDFIAHPRTFMRNNIVMISSVVDKLVAGVNQFSLVPVTNLTGIDMRTNTPIPIYSLRKHSEGKPIAAYWCPYKSNDYLGVTLGGTGGPVLMFTYMMDGCTLGVGSRGADGSCRVHHLNFMAAGGSAKAWGESAAGQQQAKLQRNVAKSIMTSPDLVEPTEYMDKNSRPVVVPKDAKIATNTFGRLSSKGKWKFYTHQWYTLPGDRSTLRFMGTVRQI